MRIGKRSVPLALFGLAACSATQALGAVSLSITDSLGDPGQVSVNPGQSFAFRVSVIVTGGEEPTGLDYFLRSSSVPAGFRITARNFTTNNSAFPDQNNTTLTGDEGDLNPDTALLGATRDPGTLGNGTFTVTDYTLAVGPSAAPGTYTITTASNPGTGYTVGSGNDQPLNGHGTYQVTVVPEPTGLAAAAAGAGLLALARRRRPVGRLAPVVR
jgi:MYXO-CTERM domain-containing protein